MMNICKHIGLLAALTACLSLTSCDWDEDEYKSSIITGEWEGDFGMFYNWYCSRCHDYHTYYADETRVRFFPDHDGATHGYGYQTDYYEDGPYSHQNYSFDWVMEDGILSLYYAYDNTLNVDIYRYSMTKDTFTGRFGKDGETFCLYKVVDYYDWSPFYEDDGCHYYYDERYNWHTQYNKSCDADIDDQGHVAKRGRIGVSVEE